MTKKELKFTELNDQGRVLLKDVIPLSAPYSIYLETTNYCNYRCSYCPTSTPQYKPHFYSMTYSEFYNICCQIKQLGHIKSLRFWNYGEGLCNPITPKMISLAVYMDIADQYLMTSNGTMLNESNIRELIDSGLDHYRISISSCNQQLNEQITKNPIRVKQLYDNMRLFVRLRGENKKPFLCIKKIDLGDKEDNELFFEFYSEFQIIHDCEVVLEGSHNEDGQLDLCPMRREIHPKNVCPHPFYTLSIGSNGDVMPCCEDWSHSAVYGNCFKDSLVNIWNSNIRKEFLAMHLHEERFKNKACINCEYRLISPDSDNIDSTYRGLFD
jgi:radical SAM protein with 4Fe4S-binding SPASM domain